MFRLRGATRACRDAISEVNQKSLLSGRENEDSNTVSKLL